MFKTIIESCLLYIYQKFSRQLNVLVFLTQCISQPILWFLSGIEMQSITKNSKNRFTCSKNFLYANHSSHSSLVFLLVLSVFKSYLTLYKYLNKTCHFLKKTWQKNDVCDIPCCCGRHYKGEMCCPLKLTEEHEKALIWRHL